MLGLGPADPSRTTDCSAPATVAHVLPALAIADLVVGVNLVADGLTQAFERVKRGARVAVGACGRAQELGVAFSVRGRWLQALAAKRSSLRRASYGLVGESGCGKSTTAAPPRRRGSSRRNGRVTSGAVRVGGADLLAMSEREVRLYWSHSASMVDQNPAPP